MEHLNSHSGAGLVAPVPQGHILSRGSIDRFHFSTEMGLLYFVLFWLMAGKVDWDLFPFSFEFVLDKCFTVELHPAPRPVFKEGQRELGFTSRLC